MSEQRVTHSIDHGAYDMPMVVALGLPITASCGTVFTPKYYDEPDVLRFPNCLACHPRPARRRGSPRIPDPIRRDLPHYVYRCYDADDRLLYVGCSYNPPSRFRQHRSTEWYGDVARTRLVVFPDRRKALDMERLAIETEGPIHNRQHNRATA